MKQKLMLLLAASLLVLMLSALAFAEGETEAKQGLLLPKSLRVVDEMAFEGTAATEVYMSEGVERIEGRAFADMPSLDAVYIPKSVLHIADDAFDGPNRVRLGVDPGSYAEKWAQKHGYFYFYVDYWVHEILIRFFGYASLCLLAWISIKMAERLMRVRARGSAEKEWSVPPKDRPEAYPLELVFP